MKRAYVWLVVVLVGVLSAGGSATMQNADYVAACAAAPPTVKTVTSGAPVFLGWTIAPGTQPFGYSLRVDGGAKVDIGLPTPGAACPAGTAFAGEIPYVYRTLGGYPKGSHTAELIGRYDDNGVTVEMAAVSVPFVAADPPVTPPVIHGFKVIR